MLDLVSMSMLYTGLKFLKDAGLYQMLRVSQIVFCGLLSVAVLKNVSDKILSFKNIYYTSKGVKGVLRHFENSATFCQSIYNSAFK